MYDLVPTLVGGVIISERRGEHVLNLPMSMDGERFRLWKKTAGGIFSKDFLSWLKEKSDPEYLLITGEKWKTVIRLIDEEDVTHFEALKLINGKLKDKYYMHFKTVGMDQNFYSDSKYIIETTKEEESSESKDVDETKQTSESLFD